MAISRRTFLASTAAGALLFPRSSRGAVFKWMYKEENYRDPVTKAYIRVLTDGTSNDEVTYHTHPMWTRDMRYVLFNSDRSGGHRAPHAQFLATGESRPLAREAIQAWVLSPSAQFIYMLRGRRLESQLVEAAVAVLRRPWRVANLPSEVAEAVGGLSMDADGRTLYAGVRFEEEGQWGIMACDTKTSVWRTVARVDFEVGHVQAHPAIPTLVMFCHETGGDAPQRIWVARENSGEAAPLYKEWYDEWVTREVWWGSRVLFTIWPANEERLKAAHGIFSADLTGQDFRLHCRYAAWHTHGSPDGKWLLGDDFDRNIWLINPFTGERRLLTQGHNTEGFNTHPHASFTPDSRGVIFQSSRLGKETIMVAEIPEWESLPKDH